MRCPYCRRTLFFSRLAWVPCDEAAAVISIRCPDRSWRHCREIVSLRLLSVPATRFDDEQTREATVKKLRTALEM